MIRSAQPGEAARRPVRDATPSMSAISRRDFGEAEARHLLLRAGFGGTPKEIRALAAMDPRDAVERVMGEPDAASAVSASERFGSIIREPTREQRMAYRRALREGDDETIQRFQLERQRQRRMDRRQLGEFQRWWVSRMVDAPAPLPEKMTLLWHGHFASSQRKVRNTHHMALQQDLFRREALGSFAALLRGIVRDPATLAYLDNHRSTKRAPNENLARELMELFSLGAGRYRERDIKEGARALTGYTFEGDAFVFREAWHDRGIKTILGRDGNFDGDDFVEIILAQRRCAEFQAATLYGWFVAPLPEDVGDAPVNQRSVILSLTRTVVANRYDLRATVRRLLLSEHFYDEAFRGTKIKSPAELTAGLLRSLGAPAARPGALVGSMDRMGQTPLLPPNVAGWPVGRGWINTTTMLARQNLPALALTRAGRRRDIDRLGRGGSFDPTGLVAELGLGEGSTASETAWALARHMLGAWAESDRNPLIGARVGAAIEAARGAEGRERALRMILTLAAAPEYQLC